MPLATRIAAGGELLRVKNFDRCQRKLRYVASLKFSSRKETVGGLPQLRGEMEVWDHFTNKFENVETSKSTVNKFQNL